MRNNDLSEYIINPTRLSKDLIEKIFIEKTKFYIANFNKKSMIGKIVSTFKISFLYVTSYVKDIDFLEKYKYKKYYRFQDIINELVMLANKVVLNNILLTYAFKIEKTKQQPVYTKSDLLYYDLVKLYQGKINYDHFRKKFGHYANNEYELSNKRYYELPNKELMNIAKIASKGRRTEKVKISKYLKNTNNKLFPVYNYLREEYKYLILLYFKDLRSFLLKLQKDKKIKNIFTMKLIEIKKYL